MRSFAQIESLRAHVKRSACTRSLSPSWRKVIVTSYSSIPQFSLSCRLTQVGNCNLECSITLIIEIYNKIVTPCFDSLAIRQSPYTKDTSSQHRYAPGGLPMLVENRGSRVFNKYKQSCAHFFSLKNTSLPFSFSKIASQTSIAANGDVI